MNNYNAPTLSDPFNALGLRNIGNTQKHHYNCGGYALGTFSWYWPGRDEEEYEQIMAYADEENWEPALQLAAEAIISELAGWQLVEIEEVMRRCYSPKEYEIVAMRFCSYDFHFWKLGNNWNWYDKAGGSHYIDRHAFKDVMGKKWNYRYDSPIICFVRMR